jgi:hypothetical protein
MWSLLSAEGGVTMVALDKVGSSACPAVWLSTIFRAKSFTDCTFQRDLPPSISYLFASEAFPIKSVTPDGTAVP